MNKLTKTMACLVAASSLLMAGGAFARGGHWHGGGHHWHGGGHWHRHWHGGGHWHRWHPFWGPRIAFGAAAAAITTAAVVSAASQPRVVYRDAPTRVTRCHLNDWGDKVCRTVTRY